MTRLNLIAVRLGALAFGVSSSVAASSEPIWRGLDLSYVNEMEDCGAIYRVDGAVADAYELFASAGANVVRLRIWHAPDWTEYGTLADVKKSIGRAKRAGMNVLLDFHYSDDWAHPGKQLRPPDWPDADRTAELARHLNRYTRDVLSNLRAAGLLPEYVAVGNEINTDLLIDEEVAEDAPIDWRRNAVLVNAGLDAVRSVAADDGSAPKTMLHVAQPENVERWFDAALDAGIHDFDLIGVSYYPKWSSLPFPDLEDAVRRFKGRYGKDVVIVETAYPWTLAANDAASNLLGEDSLLEGYPPTPAGQRRFLTDLMQAVLDGGGLGIVYWEPAWVSTGCSTRWGRGSHWENAALFDYRNTELHEGAAFLNRDYVIPD